MDFNAFGDDLEAARAAVREFISSSDCAAKSLRKAVGTAPSVGVLLNGAPAHESLALLLKVCPLWSKANNSDFVCLLPILNVDVISNVGLKARAALVTKLVACDAL